jgi:primosomal protein N' (replication factor Y) (superfamily II helicase)
VIARVAPDVAGIAKTFDYLVPPAMEADVRIGTIVRVPLGGRRVAGWVVELADEPSTDRPLQPLAKVTGWGPPADLVDLAGWAAWRWAGRRSALLKTASPSGAVRGLPARPPGGPPAGPTSTPTDPSPALSLAADAFDRRLAVVRTPPADDLLPFVLEAAAREDALVLAPSLSAAALVAARLRRRDIRVAEMPRDWALAAAGGCVAVGARAGAWAPRPRLGAVLVLDESDEAYQEERAPTWNARDVAVERARRAGVPCVLTSPHPSLDALALPGAEVLVPSRTEERAGWPVVEVIDRRHEPPGSGLYSSRLIAVLRDAGAGRRAVAVLNRKGRAALLACVACGELARCEVCTGPMAEAVDDRDGGGALRCRRCRAARPSVCMACGATRMKAIRVGVTRAREELELLVGRPAAEVTAGDAEKTGTGRVPDASLLVGTEAVLHRVAGAHVVAFLDFDQELLAARHTAGEQALALLGRAARLVGGRDGGRILIQTRLPGHEVLDAAVHADPSRFAVVESARRAALRLPPETALAVVSGPAAPAFVESLEAALDVGGPEPAAVEVLGPADGRWLVRAPDHATLADALALATRPPGRLRVEVDPRRV